MNATLEGFALPLQDIARTLQHMADKDFSNRDRRTSLYKLAVLLFLISNVLERNVLLVADAYYASGKFIRQLLANGHQLLTRAKCNAVA